MTAAGNNMTNDEIREAVRLSIVQKNCVLFLGPLFGLTDNDQKICETASAFLENEGIPLDAEFHNLFIPVKSYPPLMIAPKITRFYKSIKPGSIYSKVSRIGFPVTISFTQDDFLNDELHKYSDDIFFSYYSRKGGLKKHTNPETTPMPGSVEKPKVGQDMLYNLFGWYKDSNSIISSYPAFYEFLFSFLGDNTSVPDYIRDKLTSAGLLLFLGFDLKKWYVPLLVWRILNICKASGDIPTTVASTNDSDTGNKAYMDWLGRYPLQFEVVNDTIGFLDSLFDATVERKSGMATQPSLPDSKNNAYDKQIIMANVDSLQKQGWRNRVSQGIESVTMSVYEEIISYARLHEDKKLEEVFLNLKAELNSINANFGLGMYSVDDYQIQMGINRQRANYFLT